MFFAIIVFILILSIIIFVHEFGHFILAKKTGVLVEEFCIGFPPRIWKKKKGETLYSIGIIPFGGFNKLYGEIDEKQKHINDPKSFISKPPRVKALIVFGGVAANIFLAVIIFYFSLGVSGFISNQSLFFDYQFPFGTQNNFVMVSGVVENSPAEKKGIQSKDIVIKGNGIEFTNSQQFIDFVEQNKGKEINLCLQDLFTREQRNISIVPRVNPGEGQGPLGVFLVDIAQVSYLKPLEKAGSGFLHSFNILHYSCFGFGHLIKLSFQERDIKPLSSSVAGPLGILSITKLTMQAGFIPTINLLALISLTIAFFNILPIPALDGGKLIFLGIEAIIKKPFPQKIEQDLTVFFFVLLIFILILVTFKDIQRFF